MFYYLSFLRPPPLQATGSIKITPQVANDLRTELYHGTQNIFYVWLLSYPPHLATRPTKLTSWREGTAYKELTIPLPPNSRTGQSWRLILTPNPSQSEILLESSSSIGQVAFPVISMPIQVVARLDKSLGKQEQVERVYRFSEHRLTIREKTSFDLDKKVWDSGIGLSSWIVDLANKELTAANPPLLVKAQEALILSDTCNVIELGAGTGMGSIILGAVRSSRHASEDGSIFTTDLPSAMPLLSHNISSNLHIFSTPASRPRPFALNWDDEELPPEVRSQTSGFDVILMADVTYNTSSFPSLLRTVASLIAHTTTLSKPPPLIVLAYKERDPDERSLWDMMKNELGLTLEQVGECVGNGGAPVEFWLGSPRGSNAIEDNVLN